MNFTLYPLTISINPCYTPLSPQSVPNVRFHNEQSLTYLLVSNLDQSYEPKLGNGTYKPFWLH